MDYRSKRTLQMLSGRIQSILELNVGGFIQLVPIQDIGFITFVVVVDIPVLLNIGYQ